jgi:oligopeptide transport system ATP-binding protein
MDVCNAYPPEEYMLSDEHMTRCWLQHEMAPDTEFRRKKGEAE